jgi:hypothetical protein
MASEFYNSLCSSKVVIGSAFLWGLSTQVRIDKKTANNPLSQLWSGTIEGSCYAIGASVITSFMPPELCGIITVVCGTAIVFHKAKEIKQLVAPEETQTAAPPRE